MSSGEFGPTYNECRNLCNLSATDCSDTVLDGLIKEAFYLVQNSMRLTFATTAKNFKDANSQETNVTTKRWEVDSTGLIINGRDVYQGSLGDIIFLKKFGNFGDIQTITAVDWRSDDSDGWETQVVGSDMDYVVDYRLNAVRMNFRIGNYGDVRITGTYGILMTAMTDMPYKYKQLIALLSARNALAYAAGGSFDDIKSFSIFEVSTATGEYNVNWQGQLNALNERIKNHLKATGLSLSNDCCDVS